MRVKRLLAYQPHSATAVDLIGIESLVGRSENFLRALRRLQRLANSTTTVLISGETGTGKELFARALHYNSARRAHPFVPVNCGALPDHLFENELFGHVRGAFTDANSTHRGLLAEAEGGTLLLDEVDALSAVAQIKLLRFLQNREYRPLGSPHLLVGDVRIVAACNSDLKERVAAKAFREDLYYRLSAATLTVPALSDRAEDVPLLARHFVEKYAAQQGRRPMRLTMAAIRKLAAFPWPGNVRELESVIQRSMIFACGPALHDADIDLPAEDASSCGAETLKDVKSRTVRSIERTLLIELLQRHAGNVTHAARAAGSERRAFQRLLRKHQIAAAQYRDER